MKMLESKTGKNLGAVDICRLWMAICVVVIHTVPFYSEQTVVYEDIAGWFTRMAVPFFFCATGFFLFRNRSMEEGVSEIPRKIKKFLKLYIVWTIIYIPIIIYRFIVRGGGQPDV